MEEGNSQFGGGKRFLLEPFEFFRAFAQHHPAKAGLAMILGQGVLAAGGPMECRPFRRVASGNLGVSWGDLRKDMIPPAAG